MSMGCRIQELNAQELVGSVFGLAVEGSWAQRFMRFHDSRM